MLTNTTFERELHDSEHPYAQISRNLIRDESISPECRWLLIYLLSMPNNFKINAKQLLSHVKSFMGRDKLYKIIHEAWEAGYLKRTDVYVNNLKKGVRYQISEFPKEEFKKCFRRPDFRYTENQEALRIMKEEERANAPALEESKKSVFTPEEEAIFAKRLSEMPKKPSFVTDAYKRKVINSVLKKKPKKEAEPPNIEKNKKENLQKAKSILFESQISPANFKGKIKISYGCEDFIQIDWIEMKGKNEIIRTDFAHFALDPKEWDKIIQSWRK